MCMLFAATYPGAHLRAHALRYAVGEGDARRGAELGAAEGAGGGRLPRAFFIEKKWGTGDQNTGNLDERGAGRARTGEYWARFERLAVSPGAARVLLEMVADTDVRHVLPPRWEFRRSSSIASGDPGDARRGGAIRMTAQIPAAWGGDLPARTISPGSGDADAVLDEVEEFLTGARSGCPSPTACSRPCSSRTSSARAAAPPSWAISGWPGAPCHQPPRSGALRTRTLSRPRGEDGRRWVPRDLRRPGRGPSAAPAPCATPFAR